MLSYTLLFLVCFVEIKSLLAADCSHPPRPETMMNCCVVEPIREIERKCAMQYPFQKRTMNFCHGECVFNETGLAVNGEIQTDKIPAIVAELYKSTADFIPVANAAIEYCAGVAEEKLSKMKERLLANTDNCNPQFGMLLGCFAMESFKNCPQSIWQNTEECNKGRDFVASCPHPHPKHHH